MKRIIDYTKGELAKLKAYAIFLVFMSAMALMVYVMAYMVSGAYSIL